jgi:hypothetical protein
MYQIYPNWDFRHTNIASGNPACDWSFGGSIFTDFSTKFSPNFSPNFPPYFSPTFAPNFRRLCEIISAAYTCLLARACNIHLGREKRVARCHMFQPKIPTWVNFAGSCKDKFFAIGSFLRLFGTFHVHLLYLTAIWSIYVTAIWSIYVTAIWSI